MLANYHTHTYRCHHASGEDRAYVEAAIRNGMQVLGFSDHCPWVYENGYVSGTRMSPAEVDGYFQSLTDLREEYRRDIPIYIGFESDSQNFLYTLHYVLHELHWPIRYYKHVITPLPFEEIEKRPDRDVLRLIRQSLAHLEINGPNVIIGMLPDGKMITCCDSKKLRPVVIGRDENMVVISSEVCGLNEVMPDRDITNDIYPNERELIEIDNDLEVRRWKQ